MPLVVTAKARNQPATGFLSGAQQQALLKEAVSALAKYDDQKRTDEDTKARTARTEALPAPAQTLADQIGIKLEAMAPQFARLDPQAPTAYELRKLVAEELPELVEGYKRVPEGLRREARNGGNSPDKQLIEGLRVVDEELLRMSEQMASGDLDKLATQGRYLELKYRGEDGETR